MSHIMATVSYVKVRASSEPQQQSSHTMMMGGRLVNWVKLLYATRLKHGVISETYLPAKHSLSMDMVLNNYTQHNETRQPSIKQKIL